MAALSIGESEWSDSIIDYYRSQAIKAWVSVSPLLKGCAMSYFLYDTLALSLGLRWEK